MEVEHRAGKPSAGLMIPGICGLHYRVSADLLFTAREIDEFTALYQDRGTSEAIVHAYLARNPKFLFALGAYNAYLTEVAFGRRTETGGARYAFRLDFLLRHQSGFWDIVELKKATPRAAELIVGRPARRYFSSEVQEALAQVRTYLTELDQPVIREELRQSGISVVRPQAWIIMGRSTNYDAEERRRLEAELPRACQLLTYDDLVEVAKQRLLIITPLVVVPELPSDTNAASELYKALAPDWGRSIERATVLINSRGTEEIRSRQCARILIEPVAFLAENWDKGVDYFTTDDGDDRCIAQKDYEELSRYVEELERLWWCSGLDEYLGRRGRQSWNFHIKFDSLSQEIERQILEHLGEGIT